MRQLRVHIPSGYSSGPRADGKARATRILGLDRQQPLDRGYGIARPRSGK
jgi:hypothetical protein